MKKYIWILILAFLISTPVSFAMTDTSRTTAKTCVYPNISQMYKNMYAQRAIVYNALNLTSEQIKSKDTIEIQRFNCLKDLYNDFDQEEFVLRKLKTADAGKTAIIKQQKVVKNIAEDIQKINEKYDREFVKMLSSEQKSKYHNIERLDNREIKANMQENKREYFDKNMKKFGEK